MFFRTFFIAAFLLPWTNTAQAQTPKTIKTEIDRSFTISAIGPTIDETKDGYAPGVAVHKALDHNGRVYACVAVLFPYGGYNRRDDFLRQSSLLASNGKTIKRGFLSVTRLENTTKVSECRKKNLNSPVCTRFYPLDMSMFIGEGISCHRTNKKTSTEWLAEPGYFRVPEKIWVSQ